MIGSVIVVASQPDGGEDDKLYDDQQSDWARNGLCRGGEIEQASKARTDERHRCKPVPTTN